MGATDTTARPGHFGFLGHFADRWMDAWNSHETDRVLELLHPEIRWDDTTFWPEVIHGTDGVRVYCERIWEAMPDVRFDELGRFFDPDECRGIFLFRQYGHGPAKLNPDESFDAHGCDIFREFRDGLLSSYLASYDIVGMLRQLKALPERNGLLGGAYLMSLGRR